MSENKLTQAGRILKQLKDAGSRGVANHQLARFNLGYRSRITELRRDKHKIHCERLKINGRYTSTFIYYLDDGGDDEN